MRLSLAAAALTAALLAAAHAACPNLCSGHGTCGSNEKCECFAAWTGPDCSLRTCKYGRAWAANDNDPHAYRECSGQGSCNRATGECQCFPGFNGIACTRLACPNNCSGNGRCVFIQDVNSTVAYSSSKWDANRIETCDCDPGFFGPDCSQRRCPTGDDPLTACGTSTTGMNHVQEVRFRLASAVLHDGVSNAADTYTLATPEMALFGTSSSSDFTTLRTTADGAGQMAISYVDPFGAVYDAHATSNVFDVSASTNARDSLEAALETLPNNKVRNVKVQTAMAKSGAANNGNSKTVDGILERRYLVTFVADNIHSNAVGLQQPLQCHAGYSCTEAGCQPMVTMPFLYRYAGTPSDLPVSTTIAGADIGASSVSSTRIDFFTGDANDITTYSGSFIRLHPDSQPQLPLGVAIDDGITSLKMNRYDTRILVAVVDPAGDGAASPVDVYYTRVIHGHDAIVSDKEKVGATTAGVWGAGKDFTTTLDGFTFNGPIPAGASGTGVAEKVPVPGAPGVYLQFESRNYVAADGQGRWFEVLIKLPSCTVTPVNTAEEVYAIDSDSVYIDPVDVNVENIECSARGQCNRKSGTCQCYTGFSGVACQTQSVLV